MSISPTLVTGLAGLAAVVAVPAQAQAETPVWRLHDDHVLGTSLDLTVVADTRAGAMAAASAARAEIDRLDGVLSTWRDDSELSAINAGREATASPELFALLTRAEAWRDRTGGAFDARLGAASEAWRAGEAGDARLVKAGLTLDPATRGVTVPAGMKIDLDGFAKGHVIDRAMAAARAASPDVKGVMVDLGGDLRCWGAAPGGEGWRIGVADACETADNAAPAAILTLKQGAVAFSGRGQRDLTVDGRAAGHLLDPATGRPVTATLAACVVAPSAAEADALSTAFSVMAPRQAMDMAHRMPGVEALIHAADGRQWTSSGWRTLADTRDGPQARLIRVQNGPAWPKGFEVAIGYEIPKIAVGNYRAPYLAVWITDENKQLVRVVTMLGDNAKWIPDNYVFWRRYGRKAPGVESTARPTRAPGKYSLVWDGKDQAGKPVAQGKYTIHVEAVREHGGHSYVSSDLDLRGAPLTAQVAGKDELGGVTLRYGKKK
jgi:thiamine biosynthesis lipoprotein